jgi:glycerol-3-phosphate dehydrogenase
LKKINLNDLFDLKKLNFEESEIFDIAIIGAGVVGCAIFKKFCENGAKTVLIEKENDILEGASKGNSAILHTGFDAPPESLELECIKKGYEEYLKIKDKYNLPLNNSKALVIAWTEEQLEKLEGILTKGLNNGISELEMLTKEQIFEREPNLSKKAKGAILVHGESLIDPWSAPLAYTKTGVKYGGKLAFSSEVKSGSFNGIYWELITSRGKIKAHTVINAAGLYGDLVEKIKGDDVNFHILPRKGQFIIYDETSFNLINSIILPVPTKITKGVVLTRTVFGNILVGPTAEDQESRTDSSNQKETLEELQSRAFDMLPPLRNHKVVATFAGLRPSSHPKTYNIYKDNNKNWITVGGIRSTGLTSCLGVAEYVFELNKQTYQKPNNIDTNIKMPDISEFGTRDYLKSGYGKIICHCECVTQREIENALEGDVSAGTISGLKRRTRATMGRCQGFNCLAAISEICEHKRNK